MNMANLLLAGLSVMLVLVAIPLLLRRSEGGSGRWPVSIS